MKASLIHKLWKLVPLIFVFQGLRAWTNAEFRRNFALSGWNSIVSQGAFFLETLALVVALCVALSWIRKVRFTKLSQLAGPLTLETDDEGISATTAKGRTTIFWPALRKIIETETHFFVLSAPKYGYIIPKRAFDSPAQCAEFGALLKQKWAQHHPDVAPIAAPK